MTQNAISRLESSTYGKPTITTLKRLASVYDVALVVRFVPFSHLADWVSGTPRVDYGMSSSSFDIPDFKNDPGLLTATDVTDRETCGNGRQHAVKTLPKPNNKQRRRG